MLIVHTTFLAYAQKSSDELFGCQQYGRAIHCDLLLNEIQVNEVRANSSLVDPLTTSHLQFVNGKSGQALEMRAEYRESIEIMNSPELNPKQFSISFWMQPTTIEPYGHIVSHSNRNQSAGWQLDVFRSGGGQPGSENATLRFGVFNTNGTLFSPPQIQVPTEKFTLITGTFDGSSVKLYMDGMLVGQTQFLGEYRPDPGLPLRIGSAAYC
ncbi:MAG TPA: LamG domain-containing protein, partial [Nitrososphaera sp.]|nr:LamG domain-containing protein [Nitrososphaera sp.]